MYRYAFVALAVAAVASVANSAPTSSAGKPPLLRPGMHHDSASKVDADVGAQTDTSVEPTADAGAATTIAPDDANISDAYYDDYGDSGESDSIADAKASVGPKSGTEVAGSNEVEGDSEYSDVNGGNDNSELPDDSEYDAYDELPSVENPDGSQEDASEGLWSHRILLDLLRTLKEEAEVQRSVRGEKEEHDGGRERRSVDRVAKVRAGRTKAAPPKDPRRGSSDLTL